MEKFDFNKLEELGSGCYATTYGHPTEPDKVVKRLHCAPEYTKYLDIYRHTLNARPHWAKIFEIEISKNQVIIIQEKVTTPELTYKQWKEFSKKRRTDPDLKELVWLLQEICKRHDMCYDVHVRNLGIRADGSYAIFDPWC